MAKTTSIPGMEQSIMPLREMHGLNAVGKGTDIDFADAEKTIRMGFEVVDTAAILKVKKGVLPCFSQGGNYAEKWQDPSNKKLTRYAADPGEVSLVDRGCLPGAVIESIKNKTFEFVKSDGSMSLRKFEVEPPADPAASLTKGDLKEFAEEFGKQLTTALNGLGKEAKTKRKAGKDLHASDFAFVGDSEDTSTWKLPIHDKAHVRNALARFNQTEGIPEDQKAKVKRKIVAAAHKFGIEVSDEAEKLMRVVKYLQSAVTGEPMEKGLYEVSAMAEIIQSIQWLQSSAAYERDYEGDASTQPEDLKALLEDAIGCFTAMVEEETGELLQHANELVSKGEGSMTPEQLKKAAAGLTALHGHLKAMKAHHDGMVTHHAAHGDMHKALSGHMDTAMAHCTKALSDAGVDGATSFNAGGSGPTSTDIRAGSTGTEAHQAKAEYVEVGKASDGTPLFKRVENTPLSSMNVDDLLSKIDARLDERDTVMLRAMFAAMNNSPELLDATKAAAGVGDRSMVITKAAAAQPVTKAADAANGGAGAPAAGATDDSKPTSELFKKGTSGDMEARLKFARTIKRMSGQDTARVQDNLSSFARH